MCAITSDLRPALDSFARSLDGQAEQVDETGGIGLIVILIDASGSGLLIVQGVGEVTPALIMLPFVELQPDIAGHSLARLLAKASRACAAG